MKVAAKGGSEDAELIAKDLAYHYKRKSPAKLDSINTTNSTDTCNTADTTNFTENTTTNTNSNTTQ